MAYKLAQVHWQVCFSVKPLATAIVAELTVLALATLADLALIETILLVLRHPRKVRRVQLLSLPWSVSQKNFGKVNIYL
jgi:hypothetical protein